MMSLQLQQRQIKERTRRKSLARRERCPVCGSKDLLSEGPDQFCCSCDWDTCIEYVERGLMNNLEVAFKEHFLTKPELTPVTPMNPAAKTDDYQAEPRPVEVSA
ncbi:MAG: hypothetical protein KF681_04810 [Bdellovibrionaceae bacterium]|nr:hypothetical protein [Pseudobdellovibrionaceae bacterium]